MSNLRIEGELVPCSHWGLFETGNLIRVYEQDPYTVFEADEHLRADLRSICFQNVTTENNAV